MECALAKGPPKVTQPAAKWQGLYFRFGTPPPPQNAFPLASGALLATPLISDRKPKPTHTAFRHSTGRELATRDPPRRTPASTPAPSPARPPPQPQRAAQAGADAGATGGLGGRSRRRADPLPACHEALAGRAGRRPPPRATPARPAPHPADREGPAPSDPADPRGSARQPRRPWEAGPCTPRRPAGPRPDYPQEPGPPNLANPNPATPRPQAPWTLPRGPHTRWPRRPRGAGPRRTAGPRPRRPRGGRQPRTSETGPADPGARPQTPPFIQGAPPPPAATAPRSRPGAAAHPQTHLEGRVLLHLQGHGELGGRLLHRHLASAKTLAGGGEAPRGTPGSDVAERGGAGWAGRRVRTNRVRPPAWRRKKARPRRARREASGPTNHRRPVFRPANQREDQLGGSLLELGAGQGGLLAPGCSRPTGRRGLCAAARSTRGWREMGTESLGLGPMGARLWGRMVWGHPRNSP